MELRVARDSGWGGLLRPSTKTQSQNRKVYYYSVNSITVTTVDCRGSFYC